jgi:hypothetical protein
VDRVGKRDHPHSTRHAPSQPYAHRDNADLGSLKKVERLIDRLQRLGRLRGTSTPLSLRLDEYANQTNPPDRLRGVSPGAQDRHLQQAAYIAWRDPRVMLSGATSPRRSRTRARPTRSCCASRAAGAAPASSAWPGRR